VGSAQPQQRSGSARRRMNAAARVCAHGQVLQTHDQAAGVAADAGGDVQQPVAQRLGFADRELAVPAVAPGSSGKGRRPSGPAPARRRCGATGQTAGCAGRWPWRRGCGPPPGRAGGGAAPGRPGRVGLVGEKTWKRCPSASVNDSCAPGWGSSRRQIARVPGGQPASSRVASSATRRPSAAGRWRPRLGSRRRGDGQHRGADALSVGRLIENPMPRSRRWSVRAWSPHRCRPAPGSAGCGLPGAAGPTPGRPARVVGGGVGAGVARPQQARQGLPGAITPIQERHQRVEVTRPPAQRGGQPEPVGQLTQQRRPAWPAMPSPSAVTSKTGPVLVACTRKVPSSSGECDLEQPHSPSSGGHLRDHDTVTQDAHEKARLVPACCLPVRRNECQWRQSRASRACAAPAALGRAACCSGTRQPHHRPSCPG
jgi:hypothetical protein